MFKNEAFIAIVIILGILVIFWMKNRPKSRIEKIDYLNVLFGSGPWVQMTEDELNTSFEYAKLKASGVPIPDGMSTDLKMRLQLVSEKYKIFGA